jgi:hypothetical protein
MIYELFKSHLTPVSCPAQSGEVQKTRFQQWTAGFLLSDGVQRNLLKSGGLGQLWG